MMEILIAISLIGLFFAVILSLRAKHYDRQSILLPAVIGLVSLAIGLGAITLRYAVAQEPVAKIFVVIDGNAVGTLAPGSFIYHLGTSTISFNTNEGLSCKQNVVFKDRFEI